MSVSSKLFKDAQKAIKTLQKVLTDDASCKESILKLEEALSQLEVTPTPTKQSVFTLEEKLKDAYEMVAFSDGACRGNPGPGAWGAMVLDREDTLHYEGSGVEVSTTNNRMELQGAIEALKFLLYFKEKKLALVSDSKYVVDGISSWVPGWKKRGWKKADKKTPENLDLWQELDELVLQYSNLNFRWVKGHSGYPQNEYVDELANKALDEAGF